MKTEIRKYKAVYFSRYTAETLFTAMFTVYVKDKGFSGAELGALLSFIPLILAITLPLWSMADTANTRKTLVISAAVVIAALQFIMSYVNEFTVLALLMILFSIAKAPLNPSLDSMATIFCVENKVEFSIFRSFGSVGYIVGVVASGLMYGKIDFFWIVVISALFFTVFIVVSTFIEPLALDKEKAPKGVHDLGSLFRNKAFLIFMGSQLLCWSVMNVNTGYEVLYLKSRGYDYWVFGISTVIRVSCEVTSLAFLRKHKFVYKHLLALVPVFMLAHSATAFFGGPIYAYIPAIILAGAASGIALYLNNKYIAVIVRPRNITVATYTMILLQTIGQGIYLLLGGIILDKLGVEFIYLFTGTLYIIAAIYILTLFKKNPEPLKN